MVATAAFVLGFLVIGLVTVFLAMRGGPRGARQALHTQSPAGRTLTTVAILGVSLLFGIGLPVLVGVANGTSQKEDGPGGVKLTEAQISGREDFARNCGSCHTLNGANTYGAVGPDLDELRPPKALTLNAIKVGRARGQGQMPALLLTGKEAENVASFVEAVAGR